MNEFLKSDLFPLFMFEILMLVIVFVDSGRVYRNLTVKYPEWKDSQIKTVSIFASLIAFSPLPFFFLFGNQSSGYYSFCWLIVIPIWLGIYYLWSIGGVKSSI